MGTPVNCADDGTLLNGGFDTEEFWLIAGDWQIHDGYADYEDNGINGAQWVYQYTTLVINQDYVVDFDVLDISVTGNTGLFVGIGGAGGSESARITTPGHKRIVLPYIGFGQVISFRVIIANPDYRYVKIDNAVSSKLETFIACALNFAGLPNTNFEFFDLGGGIYMVLYADSSGITKCWFKIDINDF